MTDSAEQPGPADEASTPEDAVLPRILKLQDQDAATLAPIFAPPERRIIKAPVLQAVDAIADELQDARRQAAAIIEEAKQDAETIREQAHEQGLREANEEMFEALGKARAEYDTLMKQAESDMLELALRLAASILGEGLELQPELVAKIVANQLEHVRGRREVIVIVHPDDEAIVEEHQETLQRLVDGARLYVDASPEVPRGGCILQTEAGRIDARIDVQLQILRENLQGGRS